MANVITDFDLLIEKIRDSGMTIVAIAQKTGIDRATFYNRLKGVGEFSASEIVAISEVLNLSKPDRDKIFLTKSVN